MFLPSLLESGAAKPSAWGFSLEISAPHTLMHSTSLDKTENLVLPVTCLGLIPRFLCASFYDASTISTIFSIQCVVNKVSLTFILIFTALTRCITKNSVPNRMKFYTLFWTTVCQYDMHYTGLGKVPPKAE